MKCRHKDCQGCYQPRRLVWAVKKKGEVRYFEAEALICLLCGDFLILEKTEVKQEVIVLGY